MSGDLKDEVNGLRAEVNQLRQKLDKSVSRLEAFDKHATEKALDSIFDDAKSARRRVGIELHKNVVAGEVMRAALSDPNINALECMNGLLIALDRPFEWWADHHNEWSINQWIAYLTSQSE